MTVIVIVTIAIFDGGGSVFVAVTVATVIFDGGHGGDGGDAVALIRVPQIFLIVAVRQSRRT